MNNLEEFNKLLIESIDETLKYAFGERNTRIIYEYLERKSCPLLEIPQKPNIFSFELRMILGPERGQISCSTRACMLTPILERAIVKELCHKLGILFNEDEPMIFEDQIRKLKEAYERGNKIYRGLMHEGLVWKSF